MFASVLLILCGVCGVEMDKIENVFVTEGDNVTLYTGVTVNKEDMQILWMFGSKNPDTLIAEIYKFKTFIYDSNEEVMKDKLQMESHTGSLMIRNIRTVHSGLYKAQIINTTSKYKRFNVTVYAACVDPDKGFPCEVMCSAENGPDVTLSWFKDHERLNQTSSLHLNISLSLLLEIKESNDYPYYCVAANPVSNLSTQLNFQELCQQHTDLIHSCDFTKAVIRLIISAMVTVATVAVLVYDFKSTR